MKLLKLTAILTFFLHVLATTKVEAQCYPVFKQMQKPYPAREGQLNSLIFSLFSSSLSLHSTRDSAGYQVPDTTTIQFWDDTGWVKLSPIILSNDSYYSIFKTSNRIFMNGEFHQYDNNIAANDYFYTLLEYKNGIWDSVPGCIIKREMGYRIDYKHTEYGAFRIIHNYNTKRGTVEYLNNVTGVFVQLCSFSGPNDNTNISDGKNRIMIGQIDSINGQPTNGFAYIDGTTVYTNSNKIFNSDFYYAIDPFDDHVYCFESTDNSLIYELDGTTVINKRQTNQIPNNHKGWLIAHNRKIIRVTTDYINNPGPIVLCENETQWYHSTMNPETSFIVFNKQGAFIYNHVKKVTYTLNTTGSIIKGKAYIDINNNCQYDSTTDSIIKKHAINAIGSDNEVYSVFANQEGKYQINVPTGTYTLVGPLNHNSCGTDTFQINDTGVIISKDLPSSKPGFHDLNVKIQGGYRTRWNSTSCFLGIFENKGDPCDSAWFEFNIDSRLDSIFSTDADITSIKGNIVKGKLKNLDYLDRRYIKIYTWVDTSTVSLNSTICSSLSAGLYTSENNSKNNEDTSCQKVVYSYDPNYKSCDKEIIPPAKTSKLEYTIEFQNEGNDDAYDVVITDQLSTSLNLESLEIIGASHPYSYTLKNGLLTITFKNIFLKPKKTNEALSKGYFKYSIVTKSGLQNQTQINNTAYIYFDLNKPVITNTSVVLVSDGNNSSVQEIKLKNATITAYPNPSKGELHISSTAGSEAFIYNMEGRLLATITLQNGEGVADMSQWATGIYLVRCGNTWLKVVKEE